MHLSTYVGSEFCLCVKSHTYRTHLSTAGSNLLLIFSEMLFIGRVRQGLTHVFCRTVEKARNRYKPPPPLLNIFTGRSKAAFLLWSIYVISVMFL